MVGSSSGCGVAKLQEVGCGDPLPSAAGSEATIMTEANKTSRDDVDCEVKGKGDIHIGSDSDPATVETISYVEFYSGIGGWTMALEEALDRLGPLLSSSVRAAKKNPTTAATTRVSSPPSPSSSSTPTRRYELKRLAALDHSDLCVKVFSHNFSKRGQKQNNGNNKEQQPQKQKQATAPKSFSIERMPIKQLENWSADVWVMSPPCQPHTRQHNTVGDNNGNNNKETRKKDLDDPRSKSFLKICEWLDGSSNNNDSNDNDNESNDGSKNNKSRRIAIRDECLPSLIFLENVVGFESSSSFQRWRSALRARGYRTGHFHLTPTQVRLPNDRPRYYCVAIRCQSQMSPGGEILSLPGGWSAPLTESSSSSSSTSSPPSVASLISYFTGETKEHGENENLVTKNDTKINTSDIAPHIWRAIPELQVTPKYGIGDCIEQTHKIPQISSFLDTTANDDDDDNHQSTELLRVPEKVLKNKSAWCFDIVCPNDRRSSCFTHSYGRFIRGTGSVLYNDPNNNNKSLGLLPPGEREFSDNWMKGLDSSRLRYFSGLELARLFGFSRDFSFPSDTSPKQQWKLMGNSLNVGVASKLVELGFLLRYYYYSDYFQTDKVKN